MLKRKPSEYDIYDPPEPTARRRLYYSASKQFIISTMSAMATDSSSSSSSSGSLDSNLASHTASYINYGRMAVPRVSNEYLAYKVVQEFPMQGNRLDIMADLVTADAVQLWTPQLVAATIVNHAAYIQNAFSSYSEFRIRSCKIQLIPLQQNTVGMSDENAGTQMSQYAKLKHKAFIWYPDRHDQLVPSNEFNSYTELLESGERFTKASSDSDSNITMSWIPQVIDSVNQAGAYFPDIQMPWVATTAYSRDQIVLYAPYIVWKRPLFVPSGIVVNPPVAARYQAVLHSVIEFRNLK